ncbi:MAG: hypothetical protein A2Z12_10265 [Actinobacteria bacterium RBG_16_68_21]|nr:MAG: hypothetical protein A2Z12_10265 [Actinobacteria bacterium RBG_16_68_21]
MSAQHKAALAQGRRESRAIKLYLQALGNRRPGRPVTPVTLEKRISDLGAKIAAESDPLKAVDLRQSRIEAEQLLARAESVADMAELETGFVKYAKSYSSRKGISYTAWREAGVPAAMLRQAGISRAG